MKTCFNTITAGPEKPLEEVISACAKVRFEGIELDLQSIDAARSRISLKDIRSMLTDADLAPASVMAFDLAPFAVDNVAFDLFKQGVAAAQVLGAPTLLTFCFAAIPSGMEHEKALDIAGDRARRYADEAGSIRIALEPIGRTQLMGGPAAALEIARRSGRPNVGIMIDTFHYYLSQVSDADILAIPPEKLHIVHVNDSEDRPVSELEDKHRVHLGQGILPLDHDLGLLKHIGYNGFLSIEIFNRAYWQLPVDKVVADAKKSIDAWLLRSA